MNFLLRTPLWDRKVLVVVGGYQPELLSVIREHNLSDDLYEQVTEDPPTTGEVACHYHSEKKGDYIIWFEGWAGTTTDLGVLVHETNHLIYYLSRFIGFVDEPEAQAYSHEAVFVHILEKLSVHLKN